MNSTQAFLEKGYKPGCLIAVNSENQLQEVSVLGRCYRILCSLIVGWDKAFSDCKSQKVADAIVAYVDTKSLFGTEKQVDEAFVGASSFLNNFSSHVKKAENKEYIGNQQARCREILEVKTRNLSEIDKKRLKSYQTIKQSNNQAPWAIDIKTTKIVYEGGQPVNPSHGFRLSTHDKGEERGTGGVILRGKTDGKGNIVHIEQHPDWKTINQ